MDSSEPPQQNMFTLLWETLRLSVRLLWQSGSRQAHSSLQRQQALGVLGLNSNATPQQIKQRYRTLAKKYHPDLGGDPYQMQQLVAAYEFLMKEPAR